MLLKMAGIASMLMRLVNIGLVFSFTILAAKYMGGEEFGRYSFFVSVLFLLMMPFTSGLSVFVLRETVDGYVEKEYCRLGVLLFSTSALVVLIIALVSLFLYFSVLVDVGPLKGISVNYYVFGVGIALLISLNSIRSAVLQGMMRIVQSQVADQIILPFLLVSSLGYFVMRDSAIVALDMVAAYFFAALLSFLLGVFLLAKNLPLLAFSITDFRLKSINIKSILALSVLGGAQVVNGQVDIVFLGWYHDYTEVGIYKVALQFAMVMALPVTVLSTVLSPHVVYYHRRGQLAELASLLKKSSRVAFLVSLLFFALLYIGARFVIGHFLGDEFLIAVNVVTLVCFFYVLFSAFGSVLSVANMLGLEKLALISSVCGVFANVFFCFVLIPPFGIYGAAFANGFSMLLWKFMLLVVVYRRAKLDTSILGLARG